MEVHLCLPLGEALLRNADGVVVVVHLEERLHQGRLIIAPAGIGIVVEGHGGRDAFPEVEVAVGIEAALLHQALVGLAGEHETPGNAAVGLLVVDHHLRGGELLYAEEGILILCVAADVGESRVGSQADVLAASSDGAILSSPVGNLEVPGRGLVANGHVHVGSIVLGAPGGAFLVHVGQAVVTGVVGVGAALAGLGGEGDAVVIDAEIFLIANGSTPPTGGIGAGRAAAHVAHLAAVDAPLLAGDAAEVCAPVYLGLVEGEGLLHASLADAVAIAQAQLHGVGAGFGVSIAHLAQGGVAGAVDNPDGISACGGSEGGHHLVGLLVNVHLEVGVAHGGDVLRVGSLELLGRASCEGCNDIATYETAGK